MVKKKTKQQAPPGPEVRRRPDRDRRVRQSERMARVLAVLNLIQSRGRYNARAIAEELGCSERTVFRDLEVLEFSGIPWYFDEQDQCYRVRPDFRFPTLALTADEAIGQVLATTLTKVPGLDWSEGTTSITHKLSTTSKDSIKEILADASRLMAALDLKLVNHAGQEAEIRTAQMALLQRKVITGVYNSPYEPKSLKLTLHPYRLCLVKRAWYIIGHVDGDPEPKTFRIARFKSLRMLDRTASVPEDFDLREHFGNAWSVYRGKDRFDVELRFASTAARIVTETEWHHTQKATTHKDGAVTLKFVIDGLDEIVRWILTWTGDVEIVTPRELRELYRRKLQEGLSTNT